MFKINDAGFNQDALFDGFIGQGAAQVFSGHPGLDELPEMRRPLGYSVP